MRLLAVLAVAAALAPAASASRVVVLLEPAAHPAAAARLASASGGRVVDSVPQLGAYLVETATPGLLRARAAATAGVSAVEPLRYDRLDADSPPLPPLPPFRGPSWHLLPLRAELAWATSRGDPTVVLAILDTGLDASRTELAGRILPGRDVADEDDDPADTNGHGTFVAGVAAADSVWAPGVCPACSVLPVKVVADRSTEATKLDSAEGIVWATDHGADVISMSIGGANPSAVQEAAVRYAREHGVLVVSSAGNEPGAGPRYPGAYDGVVAVGGTDDRDRRWTGSSYGPWVDLGAPADRILSLGPGSGYERRSGTSFATPMVAGAAGLLLSTGAATGLASVERALAGGTIALAEAQRPFARGRLDLPLALWKLGAPTPQTVTLVRLAASPAAPAVGYPEARAGGRFAVAAVVVRDDTGDPVSDGVVECAARAGSRPIPIVAAGFRGGAATCVFALPAGVGGRWVDGTLTVRLGTETAAQAFRVRARKPSRG